MNILLWNGVIIYIAVLFFLSGFFIKKSLNSYEEYSLCGRSLSALYVIFTYLGTWIGGGTIVGLSGSSYLSGVGQYWILGVPYITGYIFALFFIARIRILNRHSIGDMLALRYPDYNEIIRIPAAIGLIARNVTMIGMQFSALSFLITYALKIDRNMAVLITFLAITSYTVLGGLWGVVVTDIFQGLLQTGGLVFLIFFAVKFGGGLHEINQFYQSIGKENFLELFGNSNWMRQVAVYFFTFGVFFLMSDQSDWERIYSSKTDKTAFWGYLIPITITLILLLLPAYLGVFQRVFLPGEIDSQYAVYYFIMEVLPPKVATFVLIGLFAAIMSSADSFMLASGVIFSNDIVKKFINKNANDREMIFWTRFFVVISGAIGFAFALNIDDIIFLWIAGIGIGASVVFPAYFCAWFFKRANTKGALAGMAAGALNCVFWVADNFDFSFGKIIYGMLLNFIVVIFVSLATGKPKEENVMSTYYWSPRFKSAANIPK